MVAKQIKILSIQSIGKPFLFTMIFGFCLWILAFFLRHVTLWGIGFMIAIISFVFWVIPIHYVVVNVDGEQLKFFAVLSYTPESALNQIKLIVEEKIATPEPPLPKLETLEGKTFEVTVE